MHRNLKYCYLALFAVLFLWIPSNPSVDRPVQRTYVNQATIGFQHGTWQENRTYTQPEKIHSVLIWLRMLRFNSNQITAEPPENDHLYRIALHFSDGSIQTYRLYGYSLLSKNGEPWQQVAPVTGQLIYPLFYYSPSDL